MEAIERTIQAVLGGNGGHTTSANPAGRVKPGDTILLTGATGFVAGHTLSSLLGSGFKVRATVHSDEKADRLRELYSARKGDLEVVVVEDIAKPGSFNEAVKGVTGVVHTAYPHVPVKNGNKELLDQAVSGATGILHSIVECNPDVRRVILTSSFAAMNDQHKGNWPGHTYSEADWNPIKHEEALRTLDHATAYSASKTLAERAAWDFVSSHTESKTPQPAKFTMSSILLPAVVGPIAHDLTTTGTINSSVADIYRLISGCENKVPMNTLWAWADVRDVADAHVAALTAAGGKAAGAEDRFFAAAGTYDYNEICRIIEQRFPELVREGGTPHSTDPSETPYHYKIENSRVENELGIKMRGLEESIVDTVKSLLDYEERTRRGETKEVVLAPVVTSRGDGKGSGLEQTKTTENRPYAAGKDKTACRCGSKSGECTCPPETCACEGCAREVERRKADEAGRKVEKEKEETRTARTTAETKEQRRADEKAKREGAKATETREQRQADEKVKSEGAKVAKTVLEKVRSEEQADKTKKAAESPKKNQSKNYGKLSGKIDCDCGKGEDACTCPPETCSCRGCAKKRADRSKFERGDFGNRSVPAGEGKTACRCGGDDRTCSCPPETCACKGCEKRTANIPKKGGILLNEVKEGKMMGV